MGTNPYVDRVQLSTDTYARPITPVYATCATAAATTAKAASLPYTTTSFGVNSSANNNLRTPGVIVAVRFTYANTAASPTLNISSSGACPIYKYGSTSPGSGAWSAGEVVLFCYDTTNYSSGCWMMIGFQQGGTGTATVSYVTTSTGTAPSLSKSTSTVYSITGVGTMTSASVSGEVLTITNGSAPTRSSALTLLNNSTSFSAGTTPVTVSTSNYTVITP